MNAESKSERFLEMVRNATTGEKCFNLPLTVCSQRMWRGDFYAAEFCKVCGDTGIWSALEVTLEWGDSKSYAHIPQICSSCWTEIVNNVTFGNYTMENFESYLSRIS